MKLRVVQTLCVAAFVSAPGTSATNKVLRGWLSDEQCARGRAEGGVYTGTNPECAKRCVAEGKRIVLIDPNRKIVLDIANQDAAKSHVGDYVEVSGPVNPGTNVLRIQSVRLLSIGRAMCSRTSRTK